MTSIKYMVLCAPLLLGGCYGLAGNDEMDRYFQRSETITMDGGNAKEVNAAAHIINPWPRYVGDRRIAYDARRVGSAVKRYGSDTPMQQVDTLPDISDPGKAMGPRPPVSQSINVSGFGAGSAAAVSVPVGGTGN
jgi:hypothetical protein